MAIETRLISNDIEAKTKVYMHYDDETKLTRFETVQDVRPFLERARDFRNEDEYTKRGIKEDMWHYATIPNIIQMIWLKKHGVDAWNKHHKKEVFKLLNTEYKALKYTTKKHTEK